MGRLSLGKTRREYGIARDMGLLGLRGTTGGLMAGHGAQKLFGSFRGPGIAGTTGMMESMGMRPGRPWALAAGGSEFGGGVLTALGLLHPIGPLTMLGSMAVAWRKAHWGKPIWVTEGGGELPLTNIAIAAALSLVDPGRLSMDHLLGIDVPKSIVWLTVVGVAMGVVFSEVEPPTTVDAPQTA
jgi:putative oxidoreductase